MPPLVQRVRPVVVVAGVGLEQLRRTPVGQPDPVTGSRSLLATEGRALRARSRSHPISSCIACVEQTFNVLSWRSQETNTKLRELAAKIVTGLHEFGADPPAPAPGSTTCCSPPTSDPIRAAQRKTQDMVKQQ